MATTFTVANLTVDQLNSLIKKLGGEERVMAILQGKLEVELKESVLLKKINVFTVPAAPSFIMDKVSQEKANIGWMANNFHDNFFCKTEEGVVEATLAVHRLEKDSLNKLILAQLGEKAEVSLAQFIGLIEEQANGQEGTLLVNGYANIAYIRDKKGVLWVVYANWGPGHGCWFVYAVSVEDLGRWPIGYQIVSRDS